MANKYYEKYKDRGMGPELVIAMMIQDELEDEERKLDEALYQCKIEREKSKNYYKADSNDR